MQYDSRSEALAKVVNRLVLFGFLAGLYGRRQLRAVTRVPEVPGTEAQRVGGRPA